MKDDPKQAFWLKELVSLGLSVVGGLLMAYMCGSLLDPNREERKRNKKYAALINKRLKTKLDLNPMEQMLADTVINPDDIDISPDMIYGIDDIYEDLLNKAVYPLRLSDVFCTTLLRQTRGLLLYGRPGTGKTMLAKALAKSCGCFFMSVSVASIQSKWYGDAQKLVRAIFTLAEKLQPCIVFIDEVDSFLTTRGGHSEHEASLSVKTEFMQHWEGMATRSHSRILVMGTTNRRDALDPAVRRRFTVQYEIPLPNEEQRERILQGYLKKHMRETGMGEDVYHPDIMTNPRPVEDGLTPLQWVARQTEGFAGSHLLEVCAQAAKIPIIESIVKMERSDGVGIRGRNVKMGLKWRQCTFEDFKEALKTVRPMLDQPAEPVRNATAEQSREADAAARFMSQSIMELVATVMALGAEIPRIGEHENGRNGHDN